MNQKIIPYFFLNIRGRGLRNSIEYNCEDKHLFGLALTNFSKINHKMLISAKWHRACFSMAINFSRKEIDIVIEKFLNTFQNVSTNWSSRLRKKYKNLNKFRSFY